MDLLIAVLPTGAGPVQQIGSLAHAFHAAGQDDLGIAGANGLGREHDGLEAGAAHLVDGEGGDGVGQPSLERRLPGRVLADARLQHLADDHLIDQPGRHLGPPQGLGQDRGRELRGRQLRQPAEILADRTSHRR